MTSVPPKVPKNPPPLSPGMDNPWYDYSPFPTRPKLAWPRNARVAFCVVLTLEYYELLPAEDAVRDSRFVGEFGNYRPDYRTWTQREYGNRTGIFRVLDVLDRYQVRAGVAVNAMAAERYPYLIEQFKKRKYEFIAHGHSANRMITSKMSEAEEKAEIAVIETFLPQQMDETAMEQAVAAAIAETGAASIKDMGKVMAALRAKHAATLDMGKAGPMVKARLS